MSISGKISTGMRNADPKPIRVIKMRTAATVYGRLSASSTMAPSSVFAPSRSSVQSHYCRVTKVTSSIGAPLLGGNDRQRSARVGVQFLHDTADVIFDGSFSEEHGRSNLPIAHPVGDQPQDFLFLVVERFVAGLGFFCRAIAARRIVGA